MTLRSMLGLATYRSSIGGPLVIAQREGYVCKTPDEAMHEVAKLWQSDVGKNGRNRRWCVGGIRAYVIRRSPSGVYTTQLRVLAELHDRAAQRAFSRRFDSCREMSRGEAEPWLRPATLEHLEDELELEPELADAVRNRCTLRTFGEWRFSHPPKSPPYDAPEVIGTASVVA